MLPFVIEDMLLALGQRASAARRNRGLTQQDLAIRAGIGLSTVIAIEQGSPTVQFGSWLSVFWALDLLEGFGDLTLLGRDHESASLLEEHLPLRVRSKGRRKK